MVLILFLLIHSLVSIAFSSVVVALCPSSVQHGRGVAPRHRLLMSLSVTVALTPVMNSFPAALLLRRVCPVWIRLLPPVSTMMACAFSMFLSGALFNTAMVNKPYPMSQIRMMRHSNLSINLFIITYSFTASLIGSARQ